MSAKKAEKKEKAGAKTPPKLIIKFYNAKEDKKEKLFDVISDNDFEKLGYKGDVKIIKKGGSYKIGSHIDAQWEFYGTRKDIMKFGEEEFIRDSFVRSDIPIVGEFHSEIFNKTGNIVPLTTFFAYGRAFVERMIPDPEDKDALIMKRIEGAIEVAEISVLNLGGKASSYPQSMLLKRLKVRSLLNLVQLFDFHGEEEFSEPNNTEPHEVNIDLDQEDSAEGHEPIDYINGFLNRLKDLSKGNETIASWILETIAPEGLPEDQESAKHLFQNIALFRQDNLRRIGFISDHIDYLEFVKENPFKGNMKDFEKIVKTIESEFERVEELAKEKKASNAKANKIEGSSASHGSDPDQEKDLLFGGKK